MLKKFVNGMIVVCSILWLGTGSVFAADLKLNPDTLIRIRDGSVESYLKAEEVFIGINDEKFTLNDVENCIKKYGLDYEWYWSEKYSEAGFTMYNLGCDACFFEATSDGDGFTETEEYKNIYASTNSVAEISKLLRQVELDRNTLFDIYFIDESSIDESSKDELIERISIINHGGYTLKTGWQWEDNVWRYYENDKWITGFKWIDNELYHFEADGSLSHSKFAVLDGKKYHFNDNWADRGWQILEESGKTSWYYFDLSTAHALVGYQAGIEGDSYKYFFWQEGFTDQNGQAYSTGALACGSANTDMWIFQNGNPVYVADEAGHLYVNVDKVFQGIQYRIDENGYCRSMLNDRDTYLSQEIGSSDCTLISALMMIKRKALLDNNPNWKSVGLNNTVRSQLWSSGGLAHNPNYDVNGVRYSINSTDPIENSKYPSLEEVAAVRKSEIQRKLNEHPEGIVAYFYEPGSRRQHAVLVTQIAADGTIYCMDPYPDNTGISIPLSSVSTFRGWGCNTQDDILQLRGMADGRMFLWYIQ